MQFVSLLIAPVILDVLFFSIGGFEHSPAIWIGFACVNLAYLVFALSGCVKKHSAVLNRTSRLIAFVHFLIQLSVFLVSLIFGCLSTNAAIVIHVIIALLFLIVFIANHNKGNRDTIEENKACVQHDRIQKTQTVIDNIWRNAKNPACKKALERLGDDLKSCQFSDNPAVRGLDDKIQNEVDMIREYILDGNFDEAIAAITRASQLLRERDIEIRMHR